MNELVSIILPVYNVQEYLNNCVISLVNQTYSNLEIILVDDGSTDESASICDKWASKDPRIRVVHKENNGAGMARNTGLDLAKGKFVLFVDSDDLVDQDTVKKCINEHRSSQADVVMFGRCNLYDDGTVNKLEICTDKLFFSDESIWRDLLPGLFTYKRGMGISVWGKFFNIDLFRNTGIRFCSEKEVLSEDACIMLELFSHVKTVSIIPENLYYYRQNMESLSRKYKAGHQLRANKFLLFCSQLCESLKYPPDVFTCVCVRYHMYVFSGMKKIISSDFPHKKKREALWNVFQDPVLQGTLVSNVLVREKIALRIFWKFIRLRLYTVCYCMLRFKMRYMS